MLSHGPVLVPSDAKLGKAIMRVELPKTSKYRSFPTDIPVEIR
jgi:hypothetical protein